MNFQPKTFILLCSLFWFVSSKSQIAVSVLETSKVVSDTKFVNLKAYSADFVCYMKYATQDNFLKAKVYDCVECFLRLKTVESLFFMLFLRIMLF
jgi:D-alanyl-D-alanine dipeptidase